MPARRGFLRSQTDMQHRHAHGAVQSQARRILSEFEHRRIAARARPRARAGDGRGPGMTGLKSEYKHGFVTDVETETIRKGLNEDVIRLISGKKQEPEWLLEYRLKAYR